MKAPPFIVVLFVLGKGADDMKLTLKQKRFADEYIISGNATQSAIKAGYSKKTAGVIGDENLKKPNVAEYIKKRLDVLDAERTMSLKEAI